MLMRPSKSTKPKTLIKKRESKWSLVYQPTVVSINTLNIDKNKKSNLDGNKHPNPLLYFLQRGTQNDNYLPNSL